MTVETMAQESDKLKSELVGLFKYTQRLREEIAAINKPADDEHRFENMGDQLDAIVTATEEATNLIMSRMESTQNEVEKLRKSLTDEAQLKALNQIDQDAMDVFEACSFQDITGQRISKVVRSVSYVEDRVAALIQIWGKKELEEVEVEADNKTEDEKLLHGPQLEGKGLAQDDIDKLFD